MIKTLFKETGNVFETRQKAADGLSIPNRMFQNNHYSDCSTAERNEDASSSHHELISSCFSAFSSLEVTPVISCADRTHLTPPNYAKTFFKAATRCSEMERGEK